MGPTRYHDGWQVRLPLRDASHGRKRVHPGREEIQQQIVRLSLTRRKSLAAILGFDHDMSDLFQYAPGRQLHDRNVVNGQYLRQSANPRFVPNQDQPAVVKVCLIRDCLQAVTAALRPHPALFALEGSVRAGTACAYYQRQRVRSTGEMFGAAIEKRPGHWRRNSLVTRRTGDERTVADRWTRLAVDRPMH